VIRAFFCRVVTGHPPIPHRALREFAGVANHLAGFARPRGAGAWVSASPRVQRLAAVQIALVLTAALAIVVVHGHPQGNTEPLALAAAVGPGSGPVVVADAAHVHAVKRVSTGPRPLPTRKAMKVRPASGWEYWSARIRGCESHGRPDAPPDYKAENPSSSASGAYQILDVTWAGRYGVSHASDATPAQQEQAAAELYRRHGTADWVASAPCWRAR
jgi:Transglycosylase-like domain